MIEPTSGGAKTHGKVRIGAQPIMLTSAVLAIILIGAGSVALWRAYTGDYPEQDRIASARQLQVRTAQTSEQLLEKTKELAVTQQESIDQLQAVQDQLQTVKRLLGAQQAEAKRLSDQVTGLTVAIESLRQSFASVQTSEASNPPSARDSKVRAKSQGAHRKRSK
jgi:uncharacterized protein HemX